MFVTKPSPPPKRPPLMDSVRALRHIALGFAGVGLGNAAVAVFLRQAPAYYLVVVPIVTFLIYFGGGLILLQTGALRGAVKDGNDLDVSPWFAWLVCGCLVTFVAGLIVVGGRTTGEAGLRAGGVAAASWAGLVALLWVLQRMRRPAA